jgi:tetratricopeptide (TPR) repeat protein
MLGSTLATADALSELPPRWAGQLQPIPEADISGAEPQMRAAITEARAAVDAMLRDQNPAPEELGSAYGRLGARLLLVEVESQADACLRNAMTLDPDALRWPYYAGYMALLAGNLDSALDYLERAKVLNPDYPTLYIRLGKTQLDLGNVEAARTAFEQVAETPELRSPAQYYLGQIALLQRRYEAAIEHLNAALGANPDATEVHYPLARAYQALGDEAAAERHLQRFVLRSPDVTDPLLDELRASTQRALPAFERAIHAVRLGDYPGAVDEFAAGLTIDPENAAARVSYARVLYLTGQSEQAQSELKQALADAAGDATTEALANFFIGVLHESEGAADAADNAYRQALERNPEHAGALFQLANLDFSRQRYQAAAEGYAAALSADPDAAPARLLELVALARGGAPEATLAARLSTLRESAPDDAQLSYALARLLASAENLDERDPERAMQMAAKLVAMQPIPPHQRLLAIADAASGHPERAAEAMASMVETIGWMLPPSEKAVIADELKALRNGRVPQPAWPEGDPLLSPPPFDAKRLMRDYPATKPF